MNDLLKEIREQSKENYAMLIKVLPFDIAEELCREIKDFPQIHCCVVSIDDAPFNTTDIHEGGSVKKIFRMFFADIDSCDAPYLMKYAAKQEDFHGVKNFIDEIKNNCNLLIVHCAAGISRSPAVASAIEEYLGFPDSIWKSGSYHPNRHVYKLSLQEFGIPKTEEEIDQKYAILQRCYKKNKEDDSICNQIRKGEKYEI